MTDALAQATTAPCSSAFGAVQWKAEAPLGITEQILADHAARKNGEGVTWFSAGDLRRLGLSEALFTVMQTVQHTLRLQHSDHVVESGGCTDRWSIQDAH